MELKKELGLLDIFCIATGAMVSSGLFVLPGLAHAQAGPAVVLSYFLAGLLAATGMMSIAELVTAMPKAGGDYFFITRSMGPAVGTVSGLLSWFSLTMKSAFALIGMAAFTRMIIPVEIHLIAIALCLFFIGINLIGIKEAGRVQVFLVLSLIALMLLYIFVGLPNVDVVNFRPFTPYGVPSIFFTAGFVFVSYGGLLKVASIAEEAKDPGRVIPLGMIFSLIFVCIAYTLMVFVTTGVLGAAQLDHSLTPISDGAAAFMGKWGTLALSLAAILAFVSTANAGIMAASRYPMALSRDGLLPEFLGQINARFKTPHMSILLTGFFMIASLYLELDILVKAASTVLILTYILSNLSIIILRESKIQNYSPAFRTPLYPWLQIVGSIGMVFLILKMGINALMISFLLIAGGLFVYWFYGRIRASREFALLHVMERITARELTSGILESELKEIIRVRDNIQKDRFDHIIEECTVLDIEQSMEYHEFFQLVANKMAPHLKMDPEQLSRALVEREQLSTTALTPALAIPHVVVQGEGVFDILIARCKGGVYFSETAPCVHAIFVLAGSRDERLFHLRSLAAIAQIVHSSHFEDKWTAAKTPEVLRDIVLLGERKRHDAFD